jgi:PA domain-containing protein
MNKSLMILGLAVASALFGSTTARAADIIPIDFDGPSEGYNDPAAAVPEGGNPGTTLGEQRQIVAQFAADLWGSVLQSNVPIYIAAQFNPLGANVLGSAGATSAFTNFAPGVVPNTFYSVSLANAIAGIDLRPGFTHINSQFSSDFAFYYGLDGNTPAGKVSFLDVVMHEFGHGLGFQNFEDEGSGTFLAGIPDIYSVFTLDNSTGKHWTAMTVAERQVSALNYGKVVFDGFNATHGATLTLDPRTAFRVGAPASIAGDYEYGTASFGAPITTSNFHGTVVVGTDGVGASNDGCEPLTNYAAVAGNIAILDRGICGFAVKAKNAQNAGATGVIIANNAAGNPPPGLGGVDPTVTVPTISVTQSDGTLIKGASGVQVALVVDPSKLQGADNANHPRLYMPNPVQPGSSGSHYDTALAPNALMEPAINDSLNAALNLDITPSLLKDTGWVLNGGTAKINGCDTGIAVVNDAGIIVGANVQATSNVCALHAKNHGAYQSCMSAYKDRLQASNLITGSQGGKISSCAAHNK